MDGERAARQRQVWENLTRTYRDRAAAERVLSRKVFWLIWANHHAQLAEAPQEAWSAVPIEPLLLKRAHLKSPQSRNSPSSPAASSGSSPASAGTASAGTAAAGSQAGPPPGRGRP